MTDIREQLREKVQAALRKPGPAEPTSGVAESLQALCGLARQILEEPQGNISGDQTDSERGASSPECSSPECSSTESFSAESSSAESLSGVILEDLLALAEAPESALSPDEFRGILDRLALALALPSVATAALEPIVAEVIAPELVVEERPDDGLQALNNDLADDPELVQEFLMEAREHLAKVESSLLEIEKAPEHRESLHAVFRSFHTIKGLAGFLGAHSVQELAHETENVLDLARSGSLVLGSELTDLILQSADALSRMLNQVGEVKMSELPSADPALLANLVRHTNQEEKPEPLATVESQLWTKPALEIAPPEEAVVAEPEAPAVAAPAAVEAKQLEEQKKPSEAAKSAESGVVRVDTAKLEYLIDMVGELVIAESVVRNDPAFAKVEDPALSKNLAQLSRVIEEVQKTSMSMRMVPVGTLFRKMNRLVRDLSRKLSKQVELVTFGEDVELDRTIVEELADPMIHMIRNAVDHGLESAGERQAAGKSECGKVTLKAMHDAGDIVIEICDDGKGLDRDRILAKARRVGLVGPDQVPEDADIFRLIFEPGFSTAAKVTDTSGRGVGMDVVKRHIQKLRGRIDIRSVLGAGSTFTLRLPLTLAIIDGLVVSVGSQRYILPMFAVREMFSPIDNTFVTIENRAEAAVFRDKLLPVVRLSRLFDIPDANPEPRILIVAEARDQAFCIAVDQLIGKQEVVIKNLGRTFRDVPAVAGGAILGDGRVGLILDVNALR